MLKKTLAIIVVVAALLAATSPVNAEQNEQIGQPHPALTQDVTDAKDAMFKNWVRTFLERRETNARRCVPDATTLCLGRDDRFKVTAEWETAGNDGDGLAVDDQGFLFFFGSGPGPDLLVQVLDQCSLNNHFWVFAAAETNLGFELTVTDTHTGDTRVYENLLGNPAPAITDTQAFATCP